MLGGEMNTKFTPGPWFATEEFGTGDVLVYHAIRAGKNMWDETIASTWAEPNAANAHLIAASPEIGALLAQAVRLYETYGLVAGSPECGKWVNDSRDALKKAGF